MSRQVCWDVIELAMAKRGVQKDLQYLGGQVSIIFEMPLSEIVMDFFDMLKSKSQGYASVDFVFLKYQQSDLVKVDVAVNSLVVDSLSAIMHRSDAQRRGGKSQKDLKMSFQGKCLRFQSKLCWEVKLLRERA